MRVPSIGPSGWGALGLTLASVALGGLDAPTWAWVVTLVFAGLCLLRAAYLHNDTLRSQSDPRYRPGDIARQHTSLGTTRQGQSGRIYGGAAIGEAIRRQEEQREDKAVFLAVEGEIALAHEEAMEMAKMLGKEWPHSTVDGALVQAVLPDWRAKTMTFIGTILGSAQRAAFKSAATGANELERLESEWRFLNDLGVGLASDAIRVDEGDFLSARTARREHGAASFLAYDHDRAPGAPPMDQEPLALRIDALMREGIDVVAELSVPVQPERTASGHLEVSGEGAPDDWWEKANVFLQGATDLLAEGRPALLKDFEKGFNAFFRKQKDAGPPNHANDRRSAVEKMLAFADAMRSTPREIVEASLDGLSGARRRLGDEICRPPLQGDRAMT